MLLKGFFTMGLASVCCLGLVMLTYWMLKLVPAVNTRSLALRLFAYGYAFISTLFAAFWCWQILAAGWQLLHESESAGPLGALIFPFWAAIGATPGLVGLILFKTLRTRRRRYLSPS